MQERGRSHSGLWRLTMTQQMAAYRAIIADMDEAGHYGQAQEKPEGKEQGVYRQHNPLRLPHQEVGHRHFPDTAINKI